MIIFKIIISVCITAICYQILIQRGELLQTWARYVNLSNMPELLKKLFLCSHCVAGQLSFYSSIFFYFSDYGAEVFISVPFSIVIVYFFNIKNFADGQTR